MAERPQDLQNWAARDQESFGPHFRIDTNNPEYGFGGGTIYALIAEKIGSGKASIVYVEDFTGDYISTISNPVNTFPAGNFEFSGIFSAGARKGEFAEVGSIKLSEISAGILY